MNRASIYEPQNAQQLMECMLNGPTGSLIEIGRLTVDLSQVVAVQRDYSRSERFNGVKHYQPTALLMPGRLVELEIDYDAFVEFWAEWKKARLGWPK